LDYLTIFLKYLKVEHPILMKSEAKDLKHSRIISLNMSVKTFRVRGKFRKNRKTQDFVKDVNGMKKEDVIEYILSTIGSQHHVKRYEIKIEEVEELEP